MRWGGGQMDWINILIAALGIIITGSLTVFFARSRAQQNKIDAQEHKVTELAGQLEQRLREEAERIEKLSQERRANAREITALKIENAVLKLEQRIINRDVGGMNLQEFIDISGARLDEHGKTKK